MTADDTAGSTLAEIDAIAETEWRQRAERAEAAVARVSALADEWTARCPGGPPCHRMCKGGRLRAAIDGGES